MSSTTRSGWNALLGLCALGVLACGGSEKDPAADAGEPDAQAPDASLACAVPADGLVDVVSRGPGKLDLLVVMDNSFSMQEEQEKLRVELPRLVELLATGDLDGDGASDFAPLSSLHLGVVSTNMGSAGQFETPAANCSGEGDDGLLIGEVRVRGDDPACADLAGDAYQAFEVPRDGASQAAAQVASDFACRAVLGTDGCGLEQQLEAMLKALAPKSDDSFFSGHGHGDEANEGFVRDDATLAVLIVTDEVDCSITREGRRLFSLQADDFFYQGTEEELVGAPMGINYRCADPSVQNLLQPVARYVDGLRALKPEHPERVLFSVIAGIPEAAEQLETAAGVQDFDAILALPEMSIEPGRDLEGRLSLDELPRPACGNAMTGTASPGRRFVEVAKGLGQNTRLWSVCNLNFDGAFDDLVQKVSELSSEGTCLPATLESAPGNIVACDLVETLPEGEHDCDASRGRVLLGTRSEGASQTRTVCKVNQVAVRDGALAAAPDPLVGVDPRVGWYYDSFTQEALACPVRTRQRIALTAGAETAPGAQLSLVCGAQPASDASSCDVDLPR